MFTNLVMDKWTERMDNLRMQCLCQLVWPSTGKKKQKKINNINSKTEMGLKMTRSLYITIRTRDKSTQIHVHLLSAGLTVVRLGTSLWTADNSASYIWAERMADSRQAHSCS